MAQNKAFLIILVALVAGFAAGFVMRPVLAPNPAVEITRQAPVAQAPAATEGRSTQYFADHLDEARQIVAQCREGSAGGDECANADAAVVTAEGRARFKNFTGN